MQLSALDLVTLTENDTPEDGYKKSIDLAKKLDKWGYKRLWFAEHHGSRSQASSAPEILASHISAMTEQIHVGTGGTMIMHYSPLKVAENFKTMAALTPGRVDLGIGRAPGGSEAAIYALSEGEKYVFDYLYDKAQTILDFINEAPRKEEIYTRINAVPGNLTKLPEAFMLGSSGDSAVQTGAMGIGYTFAKFFGITNAPDDLFKQYQNNFKPSKFMDKPYGISAYQVVVADTKEKADYISKPLEISRFMNQFGRFDPTMSPEKANHVNLTEEMEHYIENQYRQRFMIKGTPSEVADILKEEQEKYGFDEAMVYSPIFDHQDRLDSYQMLKEALKEK